MDEFLRPRWPADLTTGIPCLKQSLPRSRSQPDKYQVVVAEIERGIKLVTGLPVVRSTIPGWVGVRCDSEVMALSVPLRAIIVENVMVRREDDVLYVPAGTDFTLRCEIKNVVTVVAKTFHYWTGPAHYCAVSFHRPC